MFGNSSVPALPTILEVAAVLLSGWNERFYIYRQAVLRIAMRPQQQPSSNLVYMLVVVVVGHFRRRIHVQPKSSWRVACDLMEIIMLNGMRRRRLITFYRFRYLLWRDTQSGEIWDRLALGKMPINAANDIWIIIKAVLSIIRNQ